MASETHEMIVELRPEGADETTAALENVEGEFDETADSVDASAGELEGFAQQWDGAMTAILTGLIAASAGLLSQVPVVGEAMAGLAAIIEAVAFQIDQVLRPVLAPIVDFMFELSTAIVNADGALGDLIGLLAAFLGIAVTVIGAAAALGSQLGFWATTTLGVVAILKGLIGVIAGVVGTIVSVPVAIAAAIAALALLVVAFITDFKGIRSRTVEIVSDLASDLAAWADDLITDALAWGSELAEAFAEGIRDSISAVRDAADELAQAGREYMPTSPADTGPLSDLDATGPAFVEEFAAGIEANTDRVSQATEQAAGAATDTGERDSTAPAFAAGRDRPLQVILDGRRVDRGTRRFSDEKTSVRGRFG